MDAKFKTSISCILQIVLAIVISFFCGVVFPFHAWGFVIMVAELFEKSLGINLGLVGDPGSIDPGAVIVALLYLLPILLISYLLAKKTNFKIFAIVLCISSFLMSFVVFVMTSSLIWF